MSTVDKITAVLIVLIVGLAFAYDYYSRQECEKAGGVMVKSICFDKSALKH